MPSIGDRNVDGAIALVDQQQLSISCSREGLRLDIRSQRGAEAGRHKSVARLEGILQEFQRPEAGIRLICRPVHHADGRVLRGKPYELSLTENIDLHASE